MKQNSKSIRPSGIGILAPLLLSMQFMAAADGKASQPNILLAISDDQSWIHASAYGTKGVETPAFDRVAREGVLFQHAFVAAPSCAPSRAAILTGQHPWRLKSAGNLLAIFPAEWPVFPHLLKADGYAISYTGKGWLPGKLDKAWKEDPVGTKFDKVRRKKGEGPPGRSASLSDYAANFKEFLTQRPDDAPFFFWFGCTEPHLPYATGYGIKSGKKPEDARMFSFWPDNEVFRGDILDYAMEIEHFDSHLQSMIDHLASIGELDNTMIIVTSDNGNPLARSKCTLYDGGTRVPLAIRLPKTVPGGRTVTDFTNLVDLAPTILELAGVEPPEIMTGKSLLPVLKSDKAGRVDPSRDAAITHFERHTWARPGRLGYPSRAIRTDDYLYIRNYEPSRWPAGDPDFDSRPQGFVGDIDKSPSKTFLLEHKDDPEVKRFYELAVGKRPAEELYDVRKDPDQVVNLAAIPAHKETLAGLRKRLEAFLQETKDPRQEGLSPWDKYEYTGSVPKGEKQLNPKR